MAFPSVKGTLAGGWMLLVPVGGVVGVPTSAQAVMLNVTAASPSGNGHLRVFPCGKPLPLVSSVNYVSGQNMAVAVWAGLGDNGKVCVYTSTASHVVVDVSGYLPTGADYNALTPTRIADTRPGQPVAFPAVKARLAAGAVLQVPVEGVAGVPKSQFGTTVALSVTAVDSLGGGHLRVFPCGSAVPLASNVNYVAGRNVANLVFARTGEAGKVCVYTPTATHVVVDINGYFSGMNTIGVYYPIRFADTRPGQPVDFPVVKQMLPGGWMLQVPMAPLSSTKDPAAVLNVTAVSPTGAGHLRVFPCGQPLPPTSSVNYAQGQIVANTVVTGLGTNDRVCVYTSTTTHIVVDVSGAFSNY